MLNHSDITDLLTANMRVSSEISSFTQGYGKTGPIQVTMRDSKIITIGKDLLHLRLVNGDRLLIKLELTELNLIPEIYKLGI